MAAAPLAGRLVTGDARYCQTALGRQIREAQGDYLFIVKGNQPDLLWAVRTLFADPPPGEAFATAVTWDQHGGRVERRQVWASSALTGYLDWPGARQVLRVERRCLAKGAWTREVRYAITSVGSQVGAAALLEHVRGHWAIENRLHWVRDVVFGEDQATTRKAHAPQALAIFRNLAISLLHQWRGPGITAARAFYALHPTSLFRRLGLAARQL